MKRLTLISWVTLLFAVNAHAAHNKESNITVMVKTTNISRLDAVRYHDIPSVFIAKQRANLSFLLSGTVENVLVEIGRKVKEGDVLMGLYNPNLNPTIVSNLAQLDSVKARIAQIIRDVYKLKKLRKNNSISKNALEQKETELKDLKANQRVIKSQIDLARANQKESFIRAPFSGVVVMVNKQVGEFVQAGQVVIVLNQPKILEVEVDLPLILYQDLALNLAVKGTYQGKKLQFIVTELAKASNPESHLFKVILQLKGDESALIGQEVVLHFGQVYTDVYRLPLESVVDDGINKPYVFSIKDKKAFKNYIKPLYIDDGQIVFASENEINNPVVIKGQSKLSTGMKVEQN